MNKKNHIIGMIVVIIAIAVGSFYGGMQYSANKASKAQVLQGGRNGGNFAGGAAGGQRGTGQGMQNGSGRQGGMPNGGVGDFAAGEVISKDDTSITVKMRDGSSKIVFFSASTGIDKSVSGSGSDLNVGQQVTVNGKTSSDGSITAQNIQIRPMPQK